MEKKDKTVIFNVHTCYFCGSKMMSMRIWEEGDDPVNIEDGMEWVEWYAVACDECGAQGPRQLNAQEAVKAWNSAGSTD